MGKGVSKEVHDNVVADLEKTRKMLQNLTSHYDSVKIFHDSFIKTQTLPQTTNMVLLLGPKGAGKTTFLALRGAPVMPSKDTEDGTRQMLPFTDERGIVFLDSIGIGFDTRGMSKLMAYFMLTRFPSSVVSFHLDVIEDNRGSFATMRGILCNGIFPDQTISAEFNSSTSPKPKSWTI
eukprot:TRINITY_DN2234_c0_g3_i1.p1 TRINITY_DN2234_c0_g3~~TRINITY_DN2234_c0_g3_i1.p1  ORF type:complete len:178 (-),score=19.54 TRINITY_DN2234_c0_g3_i1:118-651(-)